MGFHPVEFPLRIGYGSRGGIGHRTAIHEMDSGQEQRVGQRSIFRKEFNARTGIRSLDDLTAVRHFIAARRGALHSFPVKDEQDYTTGAKDKGAPGAEDNTLGTGDGVATQYQLRKRYGDVTYGVYWNIVLPVSGTVLVALDTAVQTEGVDYTVDYSTGIVTFTFAPGTGVLVTAGCEFRVAVRFTSDMDDLFDISIEEFNVGDIPDIGMIEDLSPARVDDEYDYGGGLEVAIPSGQYVPDLLHRMLTITDATGELKMPPVGVLELGGPYLAIQNNGGAGLDIVDENDVAIGTIADTESGQLWLALISSTPTWLLI